MFCPVCGTDRKKEDTVCPRCGTQFTQEMAAAGAKPFYLKWWFFVAVGALIIIVAVVLWFALGGSSPSGISIGEDKTKYSYVDGVGWKQGTDESFTEADYKSNCSETLPYEIYAGDPSKYDGILYMVSGYVFSDDVAEPETNQVIRKLTVIDVHGIVWNGLYLNMEEIPYDEGQEIVMYGEFSGITNGNLTMDIKYIDPYDRQQTTPDGEVEESSEESAA